MRYIKKFEINERNMSRHNSKVEMSKEHKKSLEDFMIKYLNDKDIISKIKKLKFDDIYKYYFEYENIYDDIISDNKTNYGPGVIYYDTDMFIYNSGMKIYSSYIIRYNMTSIIEKYWKKIKNDFSKILDNKLINYFNKHHDMYEECISLYEDEISDYVKKECQYIIDHKKYNL